MVGLAESDASEASPTGQSDQSGQGQDGDGDGATATSAAQSSDPADPEGTDSEGTDSGGAVVADDEVAAVASQITLTSDDNEMNTQPDDQEWGHLIVSDAYATLTEDDFIAGADTKLLVVEVEIIMGKGGNVFEQAFRLQADDTWYSPLNNLNQTTDIGEVVNDRVIFQIPRGSTTVTLEGGLPASLGVGRRATYDITLTPGQRDVPVVPDEEVEATATNIALASPSNQMSTQPDDKEHALLEITGAHTTLIEGDYTATTTTKLVVIDIELTTVQQGNVFNQAFRLQADGEWYSPISNLNLTTSVGEVHNDTIYFDVPRHANEITLEAGFPEALSKDRWDIPLYTTTYNITFP